MRRYLTVLAVCLAACGGGSGDSGGPDEIDRAPRNAYNSVDVADINGDGFEDLIAAAYLGVGADGGFVSVFQQDAVSPGTFTEAGSFSYGPYGILPQEIDVADLQGDGFPDVVASGFSEFGFRTMLHDTMSPGGFEQSVHYGPGGDPDGWPKLAIADLDGDLVPDVLTTGPDDLILYVQNAAERGTFLDGIKIGAGTENLAVADIDGDGLNDIVTLNDNDEHGVPDHLLYYRQNINAPGHFLRPLQLVVKFSGQAIAVADVDADARPDIIVSGFDMPDIWSSHGRFRIYRQVTPNVFVAGQDEVTSSELSSNRLAASDLDGDGFPELIFGNRTSAGDRNTVEIFAQDARNRYRSIRVLHIPDDLAVNIPEIFSIQVADLNDDGLLDIVVSTNEIFIFFARAGQPGTFGEATRIAAQR